ncbi:MAG TPA: alpha/beta hydrolase [Roseiflexaceae bacterium]|nr:alpha/beta hydrolase [Roseiflexaceae bacterium]
MPLFVRESGPQDAPTIVWLHGGGVSGWMWQEPVRLLDEYHSLVPDLPGHGGSADMLPLTIAGSAALVADLIQTRAHGGRAYLVGISFGGQVAITMVASAAGLIERAVVSGTLAHPMSTAHLVGRLSSLYMPFRNTDWLVRANARALGVPERYLPEFAEDTRRLSSAGMSQLLTENMSFQPPSALRRAEVPTLVIVGDQEPAVMRRSALELSTMLPNGRGAVVRGANHNWCLSDPQRFADTVRAWISRRPLPSGIRLL